jgi:hypothetical protein
MDINIALISIESVLIIDIVELSIQPKEESKND